MSKLSKSGIAIILMLIVTLLAIIAAIWGWYREPQTVTISKIEYVKAPEIKTVAKINKVRVPVKEIVTYEKKAVAEQLNLSEEITKDDNKQVIATAVLEEPSEAKVNIVAIMDKNTGVSSILAKRLPLSLFALENKKAIGVRWGLSSIATDQGCPSGYKTEANIYGRWDVVRVGNVHIGLYGEVTTTGEGKAMLNAEYRW